MKNQLIKYGAIGSRTTSTEYHGILSKYCWGGYITICGWKGLSLYNITDTPNPKLICNKCKEKNEK